MNYAQIVDKLIAEREELRAELERLRAQEPVAWIWHQHLGEKTKSLRWTKPSQWEYAEKLEPLYAAPPAQPAEPVQRLSDAGIEALAGKHGTTYRNRHFPTQPAFSFSNGSLHRFVRDIESAIQPQPGWRDVETAPKDGTQYLACDGKKMWTRNQPPNCYAGDWEWNQNRTLWRGHADGLNPTHWMPLPKSPEAI